MNWTLAGVQQAIAGEGGATIVNLEEIEGVGTEDACAITALASAPPATDGMAAIFEQVWNLLGGYDLESEFKFHTTRRWRFDYCHLPTRTAIELEGGVWQAGRHNRAKGFIGDCEKYNAAARCGYTVFRLATGMITAENVQQIVDHISSANEKG